MERLSEISIIIPVRNRADIVCRTLDSVKRQTHRPVHLIVVDNDSTDESLAVLNGFKARNEAGDFKVTVLEEPRQGAAIARNTGARAAASEWLMFFDSDDVMDDCLLAKYAETIAETPDADLVVTRADSSENGKIIAPHKMNRDLLFSHLVQGQVSTQCFIVRKTFYDAVGGWNETLRGWDDWELGLRLLLAKPRVAFLLDGVYVHIIRLEESITGTDYSTHHDWWERAVDVMEDLAKKSGDSRSTEIIRHLEFRRVLLAGHYREEGRRELSLSLYRAVCSRVRADRVMKWILPLVYKYRSLGGRGAWHLMEWFVKTK